MVDDITQDDIVKKLAEHIKTKFGKLDILVNNADWCPVQPLKEIKISDYDKAFNLDVRTLVNISIESLPLILKAKGNILNISTIGATHPIQIYQCILGLNQKLNHSQDDGLIN